MNTLASISVSYTHLDVYKRQDVLGGTQPSEGLSDVHFIRLTLKDKSGKIVSENNYWRGNDRLDFTALNTLPKRCV